MKKVIILSILLPVLFVLSIQLSAQTKKVDLDNFSCTVKYMGVPEYPLKPIVANYFCMFKCSYGMQNEIGTTRVMDAMEIEGLEKVYNPRDADIYYQIDMSDMRIVRDRILERKSQHKDKHGRVHVNYYYWAEMEYNMTAVGSVIKPNDYAANGGEIILRENLLGTASSIELYRSNEFNNRRDAEEFWRINRGVVIHKIVVDHAAAAIVKANTRTSLRIGFPAIKTYFNLIITDENKHLENADFRAATQILKSALEGMTPEHGLNWSSVAREAGYFNSVVDRYRDPKHKADVRLRHAALHNLFAIYYFLDDVENATKYARLLMQNGFETRKANDDLRLVSAMENGFRRTGIATRHFSTYDLYAMDGHGNDSRYDPRGNTGTYLNNGYYDGYGQGWHDGYRARYRSTHGGHYDNHHHGHDGHYHGDGHNHDHNGHDGHGGGNYGGEHGGGAPNGHGSQGSQGGHGGNNSGHSSYGGRTGTGNGSAGGNSGGSGGSGGTVTRPARSEQPSNNQPEQPSNPPVRPQQPNSGGVQGPTQSTTPGTATQGKTTPSRPASTTRPATTVRTTSSGTTSPSKPAASSTATQGKTTPSRPASSNVKQGSTSPSTQKETTQESKPQKPQRPSKTQTGSR